MGWLGTDKVTSASNPSLITTCQKKKNLVTKRYEKVSTVWALDNLEDANQGKEATLYLERLQHGENSWRHRVQLLANAILKHVHLRRDGSRPCHADLQTHPSSARRRLGAKLGFPRTCSQNALMAVGV